MATKEELFQAAFRRFVELVSPIGDVKYVAGLEPRRPDIFTYISKADDEVMRSIFRAEDVVADEFPELLIGFHTVFLEGHGIQEFLSPLPELIYEDPGMKNKVAKSGNAR